MTTTDFNACDVYIDIITLLILKQCVSLSDKSETKKPWLILHLNRDFGRKSH